MSWFCGMVGPCMTFDSITETIGTVEITKPLADNQNIADKESTASCQDSNSTTADDAESITRSDSDADADCLPDSLEEQEELQRQQEAEEAARRKLEELERRHAEEQRAKEDRVARESVNAWMRKNGFEGMHAKKMLSVSTPYPLHRAVKQNDSVMVQLLLKFGADHSATNTWNLSPRQLAAKLNKNGSHSEVLTVLPSA